MLRWNELAGTPGDAVLMGSMHMTYGSPVRYAITVYRATITTFGQHNGWSVESLCDQALSYGGYTLADCPRAQPEARAEAVPHARLSYKAAWTPGEPGSQVACGPNG